jgi:holo-[acyl-carrier protein] synthase
VIVGIGIDLCEISRIERLLARYGNRLAHKLFTEEERSYSFARARPAESLAARFAAKEAALKALGVPPGLRWHELAVGGAGGAPALELSGAAAAAARARGVVRCHLSLTHACDLAIAQVVLEG